MSPFVGFLEVARQRTMAKRQQFSEFQGQAIQKLEYNWPAFENGQGENKIECAVLQKVLEIQLISKVQLIKVSSAFPYE